MIFEYIIISCSIALACVGSFTFFPVKAGYDFYKPILLLIGGYVVFTLLVLLIVYLIGLQFNPKKPRDYPSKLSRFILQNAEKYIAFHARVKVHVYGAEKLPRHQRFVLVCNHRSNFDPMIITQIFGKYDITFITKRNNYKIPIAKHFIAGCAYMAIDRDDPLQSLSIMKKSAQMIANNVSSIGVFPEGSRQHDKTLIDFHEGVFNIAIKANAPLIVASIYDAHQIHLNFPWKKTHVNLKILKVIQAEDLASKTAKELSDEAKAIIQKDLESQKVA